MLLPALKDLPPEDLQQFSHSIEVLRLVNEPARAKEKKKQGRSRVLDHFIVIWPII